MQCFERQALYLQLYEYAVADIPRLEYDPVFLDDVLFEFSIDRFSALITLDERERANIISFIKSVTGLNVPREDGTGVSPDSRIKGYSNYFVPKLSAMKSEAKAISPR